MKMKLTILSLTALILTGGSASAYPGVNILTTGSGNEKTVTVGVSYEDTNGVHLFRGPKRLSGDILAGGERPQRDTRIEINKHRYVWRSFRMLRTQGFYSGDPHPSRRYVQGFYSGQKRGH